MFNMLFSYKTKILADFQICISAPIIKYMAFLFLLTIYTLSLVPTTAITYVDLDLFSLIHYRNLQEKIERNPNKGKLGLGKR